ncbi:MAG: CDP-alcohol phosphatidyltransferase family protein [Phycisphaerae bacterium]|nr:CDP-alcohol phosphatidyltransferase family protein [Phycisphaerae bacterium]
MSDRKDFASLYASGNRVGTTHAIGMAFVRWRDQLAGRLIRLGATPNRLTFAGFVVTVFSAVCLAFGASYRAPWEAHAGAETASSWWPVAAFIWLFVACAFDMLDGAVARLGGMSSSFGAVLDSTLDRFSDIAIYLACVAHFAWIGNLTYTVLAVVAMANTFMISYVKARAEEIIDDCSVGWWLRGERCVAMLITTGLCHIPTLLWSQATLPALTVLRRIVYTRAALEAKAKGSPPPNRGPLPGLWRYVALWRFPRGSIPFDIVAGSNIAFLIVAPWIHPFFYGATDPLRTLVAWLTG